MLVPIADILLVERRICLTCNATFEAPSHFIHRLERSPNGEPLKSVMHIRHDVITALEAKREPDAPVELRAIRVFDIHIPSCLHCFHPNISWPNAQAIIPERPLPTIPYSNSSNEDFTTLARQLRAAAERVARRKAPLRNIPDTIAATDL